MLKGYISWTFERGHEVIMVQEEPVDRTVEDHHLQVSIALKRAYDLFQLRNRFRSEDIQRRMIKSYSPIVLAKAA